jgi:hypothetical protein
MSSSGAGPANGKLAEKNPGGGGEWREKFQYRFMVRLFLGGISSYQAPICRIQKLGNSRYIAPTRKFA